MDLNKIRTTVLQHHGNISLQTSFACYLHISSRYSLLLTDFVFMRQKGGFILKLHTVLNYGLDREKLLCYFFARSSYFKIILSFPFVLHAMLSIRCYIIVPMQWKILNFKMAPFSGCRKRSAENFDVFTAVVKRCGSVIDMRCNTRNSTSVPEDQRCCWIEVLDHR